LSPQVRELLQVGTDAGELLQRLHPLANLYK
jgi:hypothetical protein